jgi:dolichyl-phosphate-mannose--protein O-mannosyl transferase
MVCTIINAVCVALMDAGIMTTDMITSCSAGKSYLLSFIITVTAVIIIIAISFFFIFTLFFFSLFLSFLQFRYSSLFSSPRGSKAECLSGPQ